MKRIYVNEQWCLACHLCEYYCAYANSGIDNMVTALKGVKIAPRIKVEENEKDKISFAVNCRHCTEPLCVKSCITGALSMNDGVINIDHNKCVGCCTCIMVCPYGALSHSNEGAVQKCELCLTNSFGEPQCVQHCPNNAIVYEERQALK